MIRVRDAAGRELERGEAEEVLAGFSLDRLYDTLKVLTSIGSLGPIIAELVKHGARLDFDPSSQSFAGYINVDGARIGVTVSREGEKWFVAFTLPFEYNPALAWLAGRVAKLKEDVEELAWRVKKLEEKLGTAEE